MSDSVPATRNRVPIVWAPSKLQTRVRAQLKNSWCLPFQLSYASDVCGEVLRVYSTEVAPEFVAPFVRSSFGHRQRNAKNVEVSFCAAVLRSHSGGAGKLYLTALVVKLCGLFTIQAPRKTTKVHMLRIHTYKEAWCGRWSTNFFSGTGIRWCMTHFRYFRKQLVLFRGYLS